NLPASLARFADRVTCVPYQDWRVYPWALARCRVALAPVAMVNDFTSGKSALKFFEAGIFGVATVATPTEPFLDAIRDGENGYLADDETAWVEKIRLALDRRRGHELGRAARESVQRRFSFDAHRGRLLELLRPLIGHAPGPPPRALSTAPIHRGSRADCTVPSLERAKQAAAFIRCRIPRAQHLPIGSPAVPLRGAPMLALLDPARFEALLRTIDVHGADWITGERAVVH